MLTNIDKDKDNLEIITAKEARKIMNEQNDNILPFMALEKIYSRITSKAILGKDCLCISLEDIDYPENKAMEHIKNHLKDNGYNVKVTWFSGLFISWDNE